MDQLGQSCLFELNNSRTCLNRMQRQHFYTRNHRLEFQWSFRQSFPVIQVPFYTSLKDKKSTQECLRDPCDIKPNIFSFYAALDISFLDHVIEQLICLGFFFHKYLSTRIFFWFPSPPPPTGKMIEESERLKGDQFYPVSVNLCCTKDDNVTKK